MKLYIVFLDHNGIKLETNNRKITGLSPNSWKAINSFLIHMSKRKSQGKKYTGVNKNENTTQQNLWDTATAVPQRETNSTNCIHQK